MSRQINPFAEETSEVGKGAQRQLTRSRQVRGIEEAHWDGRPARSDGQQHTKVPVCQSTWEHTLVRKRILSGSNGYRGGASMLTSKRPPSYDVPASGENGQRLRRLFERAYSRPVGPGKLPMNLSMASSTCARWIPLFCIAPTR